MTKITIGVPVYNVEEYIYDMLRSVENQTFRDFEVIIVDDGSTDRSSSIAKQFVDRDHRFKYFRQENAGVSAARNKAMSLATGDYIIFFDADDFIPKDSLEKLYKVAEAEDSDMVVGVIAEMNLGDTRIYMHSQKLAQQKKINLTDEHFIGAWSLCHKLFSLDVIRRNNLQFERLKNGEDGVFTYKFLNCAKKVNGSDVVSYVYYKRPFWLAPSATQIVSRNYLDNLTSSHIRIKEEVDKLICNLSEEKKAVYLSKLYYRYIEEEMINDFYRGIWRAEEDLTEDLTRITNEYREFLTDKQWKKLEETHKDIFFERGYMNAEQMSKIPAVAIFIDGDFADIQLNRIMGSIYNQAFPRFEVLVKPIDYERLEETFKSKLNLRKIDACNDVITDNGRINAALAETSCDYFVVFDEYAMYTKQSLKQMVDKLMRDSSLDYASTILKGDDKSDYASIKSLNATFGYTKISRTRKTKLASVDNILSNKVFRRSAIERGVIDIETLNGYRFRKRAMITDLDSDFFLKRCKKRPSKLNIAVHNGVNRTIDKEIQALKRHITREDIDKVKGLIQK